MLHAVAELAQHSVGNVERVLRDEINADALRTDQPHHLFDLVEQRFRCFVEQQVCLVEKEDELGLVEVTHFGQMLEQLGQHPQQEGRIELGRIHQAVGGEDVDHTAALVVGLHEVVHVEHRLAEKGVAALLFDFEQRALDGTDRGRGDIAVFGGEVLGVVTDVLQHRAQVFGVE